MVSSVSDERRQRILDHMNRNHKPELSRYLQHYAGLSARLASSSPELRDLSLDGMLIRAGGDGREHHVPFDPPLSSWEDVRPRVVDMDATARAALGLDDIVLIEYAPPRGFGALVFGSVLFYAGCWSTMDRLAPDSPVWRFVSDWFPGGVAGYRWIVKAIFWPVLLIHIAEAVFFDSMRLRRHGVPRWSRVWWLWILNCLVEGAPCWKRMDAIIASKRVDKSQKKH